MAKRIYNLPVKRQLEYRQGKTLNGLNKGSVNLEASLGQSQGNKLPTSYINYTKANPKGPFTKCVVVPNEFNRAYCNCRYNGVGREYTLHRLNIAPNEPALPRSATAKP
jgi:hypothetical protein